MSVKITSIAHHIPTRADSRAFHTPHAHPPLAAYCFLFSSLGTCRCHSSLFQCARCTRQVSFRKLSRHFRNGPATRTAMQVLKASPAALPHGRYSAAYDVCGSMRTTDTSKAEVPFVI